MKKKLRILIAALVLTSGLLFVSFTHSDFEIAKNLEIFSTLYKELNYNYVDDIKHGDIMKKAIDAMLESLDPYTNYISESELEDIRFMTSGTYGGIGALIQNNNERIIISDPYEGFPAQKAGLRAGDEIIIINGTDIKGKSSADVSTMLKGQAGTPLELVIKRPGEDKQVIINLEREEIKIPNVNYYSMLSDNIAYIKLISFTENAGKEFHDAFVELKRKNQIDGVIIDLRGNGGGLLNEAVNICNLFVDKGQLIVSTKGKVQERNTTHRTLLSALDTKVPVAVLVDRGSASASEIVAGAIQDLDRGVIVGERTFGKGLVQNVVPLNYNAKLKVTVAKYYIPSGRCIQAIDYTHRNEDGSVGKIADSLITAFKTKNERVVYDGGGIVPDVKVAPAEFANITISLMIKSHIFNYATTFVSKNKTIDSVNRFKISDAIYQDFTTFLSDKDFDYVTKSEKMLDDLKKNLEKENYFIKLQPEFEALHKKMLHNKNEDLITYKKEISQLLKEEIASRYYYQKGRIQASFEGDSELDSAIKILTDKVKYQSMLSPGIVIK